MVIFVSQLVSLGFPEIALSFSLSTILSFPFIVCMLMWGTLSSLCGILNFCVLSPSVTSRSASSHPSSASFLPMRHLMLYVSTQTPCLGSLCSTCLQPICYFFPQVPLDFDIDSSFTQGPSSHRHQTSESSFALVFLFLYLISPHILWVLSEAPLVRIDLDIQRAIIIV